MEGSDQLLTVAEIGATLAGFTAIVGIFGRSGRRSEGTRLFFWLMIEFSFAMILFCVLPLVLSNFGVDARVVWSLCSTAMATFIVVHLMSMRAVLRSGFARGQLPRFGPLVVTPLFSVVFVVQVLNALAVGFERTYAAYFLGLVLFLGIALTNFALLVTKFWESSAEPEA
jgi:hypothetical protein